MSRVERGVACEAFPGLEVGDSISSKILLEWQFISPIPADVAQWWVTHHFPESVLSTNGSTSSQGAIKTWEDGVGIVIAAPTASPGEERLFLLHKAKKDDFRLYLLNKTRKILQGSED